MRPRETLRGPARGRRTAKHELHTATNVVTGSTGLALAQGLRRVRSLGQIVLDESQPIPTSWDS